MSMLASGCGQTNESRREPARDSQDAEAAQSAGIESLNNSIAALSSLSSDTNFAGLLSLHASSIDLLDGDDAMALSICRCERNVRSAWWSKMLEARGALHESLMPEVRMEIRTNGELRELLKMPAGIRDVLKVFFANDSEISARVRDGVLEKLANWLRPTFQPIKGVASFVYDGFAKLIGSNAQTSAVSSTFSATEQAQKWLLIGSSLHDGFGLTETSAQVSLMKTMSEWRYLFGIMRDEQDRAIGGLTLDVHQPNSDKLHPFDPRIEPDYVGMISGNYSVFYPASQAVDLATNVEEVWTNHRTTTILMEQALLWEAAAEFYEVLRPSKRNSYIKENVNQDTLPSNAHQLALLWIGNMEALLDGPFIDKEAREIYKHAKFTDKRTDFTKPDQSELAALVRALSKWSRLLSEADQDIDDMGLRQRMLDGALSLKNALRLSLQTLLASTDVQGKTLQNDLELLATLLVAQRYAITDSDVFMSIVSRKISHMIGILSQPAATDSPNIVASLYLRAVLFELSNLDWIEPELRDELLQLSRQ